ncbi:MAG: hypothetical protein LBJ72_02630 [Dysgonamonadaceae bacterium]|jgi:hypothetical protein|nr:hypothetical protein [Dysgonamonadaceae bacterium]
MKSKQTLWIVVVVIAVLVLIIGVGAYFIWQQKQQMNLFVEQSELDKQELEDEYNQLSLDYEGYKISINNDSLLAKLETEQVKVQRLQEELRTVKSTNITRINELKKELETLRKIMRGYVQQIDSLNRLNQQLTNENREVTAKYKEVTQTATQLSRKNEQLTETVNLASRLDAGNIVITGINNKNKPTNKISKMDQIAISFTINKNITAPTGEKTVYIRIQKPDDDILVKNRRDVFLYESKEINYSIKKMIEYGGEEFPLSMYWKIEEFLSPGAYRIDIFADGNRIGSQSFRLEK